MYEPHYLREGESRDAYLSGSSSRQQWVPRPNPGRLYLDKALVILASKGLAITPADLCTSLDGLLEAKADVKPIYRCSKLRTPKFGIGRSVGSQRLHDVDARGPGRGHCRRDDRCGQQHKRGNNYRQGARHADVKEIAAGKAGQEIAASCACDDSSDGHDGAFDDDSGEETLGRRAESEADAEFADARADGESEDARDSHQCNGKSDPGEYAEDHGIQAIGSKHFGANVFEGSGALDGLIHGHVPDDFCDGRDERIGIRAGVNEEAAAPNFSLVKGAIDGEGGAGNNVFVIYIGGDADDAACLRADINKLHHRIGPINVAIHGVLRWEHAFCQCFTDDDDRLFALAVECVEVAAGDDGNA